MIRCGSMRAWLVSYAIIVAILSACASRTPPPQPPMADSAAPREEVGSALAWSADGATIVLTRPALDGCTAEWIDATSGEVRSRTNLPECPSTLRFLGDGSGLAVGDRASWRLDPNGVERTALLDRSAGGAPLERTGRGVRIDGAVVELEGQVLSARWVPSSAVAVAHVRGGGADRLIRVAAGESPALLAGPFERIDSYDLDPHGNELVFSALREGSFDVALAPAAPGEPNWIPADRLDERRVSWAPRGNKVTYAIEGGGGTVLRTVHIPTGFQLGISLPWSRVDALAWDPAAERFVVSLQSPDRDLRLEVMRYGGEERRVLVGPEGELGSRAEALAGVEGGVLVPPATVRYNEKVPVVVWADPRPLAWNADRARLHQNRSVTTVVVPEGSAGWAEAVRALPWVDPARMFVVVERPGSELIRSLAGSGATILTREHPSVPGLEVVRTDSSDLRRFAADWIEARLESATNR